LFLLFKFQKTMLNPTITDVKGPIDFISMTIVIFSDTEIKRNWHGDPKFLDLLKFWLLVITGCNCSQMFSMFRRKLHFKHNCFLPKSTLKKTRKNEKKEIYANWWFFNALQLNPALRDLRALTFFFCYVKNKEEKGLMFKRSKNF